jgi:cell wall assembly regulator SMI1
MENETLEWNRIEAWFQTNLPEVIADLNPPASEDAINHAEAELAITLPESFKALYRLHNGQQQQSFGVFFGQSFLSLERMFERRGGMLAILEHEPEFAIGEDMLNTSIPEKAIQLRHVDSGWIPFAENGGSEYLSLDFHPGECGHSGQIINFGRLMNNKLVIALDFAGFLKWVADELERGKGRVYEAVGLRLFDHADLGDGNLEDGLLWLLYKTRVWH